MSQQKPGRGKVSRLRDVAAAAGVTPMTVSNVLNGRPGASAETRARVLREAERLSYRPDANARRLRLERTGAIGVVVLDSAPDYLRDPFITNVIAGLGNVAAERAFSLVLQGVRPQAEKMAPLLAQSETDALCLLLSGPRSARERLMSQVERLRQPVVLVQEREAGGLKDICLIRQDDHAGGQILGTHLRGRLPQPGTVFFLTPELAWTAQTERIEGLREGLGKGFRIRTVPCGDESFVATQESLAKALERHPKPVAIVGGNDQMALAAVSLLQARGIAVPEAMPVAGFNGFEMFRYVQPALTTIVSPAYEIGVRAGEEIVARLEQDSFREAEIALPVQLREGGSC
ncbi:LacI family DNA-binding transcriptional regulator [Pseudoroseomonas wenyumeiae]|uniref:LacI family DNA-binding transcriptional regulator n=1 Tax=Teichococcus wenyumeiae TaxID=2478470 RepID=A0A3A9JS00_9PROT|nr:LacI family DNA-binding transcriptional regulator [Pseudoroseomonas wenyumeiae]RKK03468.1 LacI family transcriptional regulator [Pseudoroseomonas wenyumeiae]RMI20498.1 LacI family DNA-binding transcriptional regulator [Pseudoroseomonas wenyumeiae]